MPSITRVGGDTPESMRNRAPMFVKARPGSDNEVHVEATAFDRARNGKGLTWTPIAHLGRSKGAMVALPQGQPATTAEDGLALDYRIEAAKAGPAKLTLNLAPTLDTIGPAGVRIGVSCDNGPVQILQAALEPTGGAQDTPGKKRWAQAVIDNLVRLECDLGMVGKGPHTISVWRIDDNVLLQKLIFSIGDPAPRYL
jgi:hypothetical protein